MSQSVANPSPACDRAHAAFVEAALEGRSLAREDSAHLAACPVCRDRLDHLAVATLSGFSDELSCAECRAQLATDDRGAPPNELVALHVATCPECDATARTLADARAAMADGSLEAAPHTPNIDLSFLDSPGALSEAQETGPTMTGAPSPRRGRSTLIAVLLLLGLVLLAVRVAGGGGEGADGTTAGGRIRGAIAAWFGAAPSEDGAPFDGDRDGRSRGDDGVGDDGSSRSGSDGDSDVDRAGEGTSVDLASGKPSLDDPSTATALALRDRSGATAVVRRTPVRPALAPPAVAATATAGRRALERLIASATARSATATAAARPTRELRATATATATATPTPTATPTAADPTETRPPDSGPELLVVCRPERGGPIDFVFANRCPSFPARSQYDRWRIDVQREGRWQFSTCGLTDLDTILALYREGDFDPAAPCARILAYSDDGCGGEGVQSVIDTSLKPGVYELIVAEKTGDVTAPYALSIAASRSGQQCPTRVEPPPTVEAVPSATNAPSGSGTPTSVGSPSGTETPSAPIGSDLPGAATTPGTTSSPEPTRPPVG